MLTEHMHDIAASSAEPLLLAWGAREKICCALIAEDLTVLWQNAAASADFAMRKDIEVRDNRLAFTNAAQFDGFLERLRDCGQDKSSWCVPCKDGGHVILWFQEILAEKGCRVFSLMFRRSMQPWRRHQADLKAAFNLTNAEDRVLSRLVSGRNADAVAQEIGISIETVRSHIRQIYVKLDVCSREGMFHRLRPYYL